MRRKRGSAARRGAEDDAACGNMPVEMRMDMRHMGHVGGNGHFGDVGEYGHLVPL